VTAPSSAKLPLPASIKVIERGWLSANNIVFAHPDFETAVVDSGYDSHKTQTLALIKHTLGGRKLDWLVNTHCHSDHMGGNAALQRAYACRTTIPEGEAPLIREWSETALMLGPTGQTAERFTVHDTIMAGDMLDMGGIDWQTIAAPGHDMHAMMFYSEQHRILISGDALWENGFGVIFPVLFAKDGDETGYDATQATLNSIAKLDIDVVIPGHGAPFGEVANALARANGRLAYFRADIKRLARHCLKVILTFALLDKRRIETAGLADYLYANSLYRDINVRFLGLGKQELADFLTSDLEKAGAIERKDGAIVPLVAG
jgi:glyoxylase-like metal-dependent hydrolase (beta-lactamase superfamily II)